MGPELQNEVHLVLSEEERAKGFVRPVRLAYIHVGLTGPKFPLRDSTEEEKRTHGEQYVKFEEYPSGAFLKVGEARSLGRFWSQEQLDDVGRGCETKTTMGQALAETYARNPSFYGSTYCCGCQMYRPVGKDGEFMWEDGTRVGT